MRAKIQMTGYHNLMHANLTMKLLALLVILSAGVEPLMAKMFGNKTYERVFYCMYQNSECVESNNPRQVAPGEIYEILADVAKQPKNFLGFIDNTGATIQFYVEKHNKIWIDIPSVKEKGSYGKYINNVQFSEIVDTLTEPFEIYIDKLELKLQKW